MKAHDGSIEPVILPVVLAEFFSIKLFPAVARFGVGRVSVVFLQWSGFGIPLFRLGIDAG